MKVKELISRIPELVINTNVIIGSVISSFVLSIFITPFLGIPLGIILGFYMDKQFER
ncbi:VraH family peptide resistance protein [Staphylococcus americanisciuri]|uniref:VraH family protein n=1 Tax=Staphylococcus americanisciuri TaxID=2973940 RepID=A0ABT2F0A1_9STAP|nr:VraH family protein [Staphylococcus americanisciuri]MCS4485855.1 VraH family protein [Staphylococcus americanisciuri]